MTERESTRWERREAKRRQRQAVHGRSLEAVINAQRNRYPQNDSESLIAPDAMQDSLSISTQDAE